MHLAKQFSLSGTGWALPMRKDKKRRGRSSTFLLSVLCLRRCAGHTLSHLVLRTALGEYITLFFFFSKIGVLVPIGEVTFWGHTQGSEFNESPRVGSFPGNSTLSRYWEGGLSKTDVLISYQAWNKFSYDSILCFMSLYGSLLGYISGSQLNKKFLFS